MSQVAKYAISKQGIKQLEITFRSIFSLFPTTTTSPKALFA